MRASMPPRLRSERVQARRATTHAAEYEAGPLLVAPIVDAEEPVLLLVEAIHELLGGVPDTREEAGPGRGLFDRHAAAPGAAAAR